MEVIVILLVSLWFLLIMTVAVWLGVRWFITTFQRLAHPGRKSQLQIGAGFQIEDDYPI